jgi:signal peptidase I
MDILQRVVYMVTLSLVDIDKDENGQPKHHFLIKRAIGMPGDRIRMNDGNVEILTPGESTWTPETELKNALNFTYQNWRSIEPDEYGSFRAAGVGEALFDEHLPITAEQVAAIKAYYVTASDSSGKLTSYTNTMTRYSDDIEKERWDSATRWAIDPSDFAQGAAWRKLTEGYYVPADRIFPMGDNRDNSRDARYFGPVRLDKVLGKGLFRYWPLGRLGGIR